MTSPPPHPTANNTNNNNKYYQSAAQPSLMDHQLRFSFTNTDTTSNGVALYGVELEGSSNSGIGWINNIGNIISYDNNNNDGNNTSRWPRQETLTLLEIRSRLNSRFKDTNQKGPLWDQISRYIYLYTYTYL